MWVLLVALAVVAASGMGCSLRSHGAELQIGKKAAPTVCFDGLPVRILVHPACGICGWSCLPDRWQTTRLEVADPANNISP